LTGQDCRVLELPVLALACRLLGHEESVIYGLQLTLETEWEERPVLVEEGVVVLPIAGTDGSQAVTVDCPCGGIGAIVFADPARQSLMKMETRQIQIVVVEMQILLYVEFTFQETHDQVVHCERTGDVVGSIGIIDGTVLPLEELAEVAAVADPLILYGFGWLTHPFGAGGQIRRSHVTAERETHQRLIALFDPFVANANDGIGSRVILENAYQFCQATAVACGHAIDLIENNTESTMAFGTEIVADILGVKERLDEV